MTNQPERPKFGIDKIEAQPIASDSKSTWGDVISKFNPIGAIAESYARTLAYKIETKRLDLEIQRVKEQASVINNQINSAYNLKMEELKQRRIAIEQYFATVQQQLSHLHIERMQILKMAELANTQALHADTREEKHIFKEYALEIIKTIPLFGDKANQALSILVNALPNVQVSNNEF